MKVFENEGECRNRVGYLTGRICTMRDQPLKIADLSVALFTQRQDFREIRSMKAYIGKRKCTSLLNDRISK
jgi:hypothetical protein